MRRARSGIAQQLDKVEIRSAVVGDAEAMTRLSVQLGYEAMSHETAQRLEALIGDREHEVYVAVSGGMLVGWIHVHLRPSLLTDEEAEIAALVVDEEVRSRGIGRVLVERAERWAQEQGCRTIRLRSNAVRLRAHAFYERLGYEGIKTSKVFRKTLG